MIVNRLNNWILKFDIIHPNQYGFQELKTCELAISRLMTEAQKSRYKNNFSTVITLDIKSAFDNLNWRVLFQIFDTINMPLFFKCFIANYLRDRTIFSEENNVLIKNKIYKGAPQGSVIAPIIWLIYINKTLRHNNDLYYLQAFADDIIVGNT